MTLKNANAAVKAMTDRWEVITRFAMEAAGCRSLAVRCACQHILITWARWAETANSDLDDGITTDWTGPLDHLHAVPNTPDVPSGYTDFAWEAAEALNRIDATLLRYEAQSPFQAVALVTYDEASDTLER